jgi:hypothetical protein
VPPFKISRIIYSIEKNELSLKLEKKKAKKTPEISWNKKIKNKKEPKFQKKDKFFGEGTLKKEELEINLILLINFKILTGLLGRRALYSGGAFLKHYTRGVFLN